MGTELTWQLIHGEAIHGPTKVGHTLVWCW